MALRLIIAENNDLYRETLGQMLVSLDGLYALVGEADNGVDAVAQVSQNAPDVLILDLKMPQMDGFEVLKTVRPTNPGLKILVLTMNQSVTAAQKALKLGADGYCTKTSSRDTILEALEQVARGKRYISADLRNMIRAAQ